jgi:flagellar protein FlbD
MLYTSQFVEEVIMIHLTRFNRSPLVVNSDLIEHIEVTPDTLIVLTTGQKILVLETAEEIVERVVGFRRMLLEGMCGCSHPGCPYYGAPVVQKSTESQICLAPVETSLA